MPPETRDIAFLLGAGASIPSGYPSTEDLTEIVLSGQGISRHTDGCYYFGDQSPVFPFEYVRAVTHLIGKLKARSDEYLGDARGIETNYEDLLYLLIQLTDEIYGEAENPALVPFLSQITPILNESASMVKGRSLCAGRIATEAKNYIRDVVANKLREPPKNCAHLSPCRAQ